MVTVRITALCLRGSSQRVQGCLGVCVCVSLPLTCTGKKSCLQQISLCRWSPAQVNTQKLTLPVSNHNRQGESWQKEKKESRKYIPSPRCSKTVTIWWLELLLNMVEGSKCKQIMNS